MIAPLSLDEKNINIWLLPLVGKATICLYSAVVMGIYQLISAAMEIRVNVLILAPFALMSCHKFHLFLYKQCSDIFQI